MTPSFADYLSSFPTDGSLQRELEIFNQTEGSLNRLLVQQALKRQEQEKNRCISRNDPTIAAETTRIFSNMTSPVPTSSDNVTSKDLEVFKKLMRSSTKAEKQEWPGLKDQVRHLLYDYCKIC
jgi:hypothetical protein